MYSACRGKVLLLSPSLAGPQEVFAFTQIHMLLVPYREPLSVFSVVSGLSQAHFMLFK